MRSRTLVVLVGILFVFGGVAFLSFSGGVSSNDQLTELWVSDTVRDSYGNHHAAAVGRVQDQGMVYAPISSTGNANQCDLVALNGTTGNRRWNYPISQTNCTIHSVADPTLADYDSDGTKEVLAATTEKAVIAFQPLTGEEEFRYNLSAYGYTQPLVTDFTGDSTPEIIVTDVKGTVFVLRPNGTAVWTKQLSSYTWGQPAVADFDGDGASELVVGLGGTADLYLFEQDGTTSWHRANRFDSSITWMTTGQADADGGVEAVVATANGRVAMVDGTNGTVQWQQDFGSLAAVHAFGDGDGDGNPEVYAVAQDGKLRSLQANDGTIEWTTTLTTADVQMTPPPSMGDIDGDGEQELVAVTNNGIVSAIDPDSGEVLDSYKREVSIYTHPTLADLDGDDAQEVIVIYADGRVVAFSFSESN